MQGSNPSIGGSNDSQGDELKFLLCQPLEKIIVSWKTMFKKAGVFSNTLESWGKMPQN